MRVATFGTGNMARTLGGALAEAGHEVFFGSREAARGAAAAGDIGRGTRGGSNAEAAGFGAVILHTVRQPPTAFLADVAPLAGKVLVDLNNRDFPRDLTADPSPESLAEAVARAVPAARVVKAFNTQAQEAFDHPPADLRRHNVATFLAGDDPVAKATVAELARSLGLVPVDLGPLAFARVAESAADLIRAVMGGGAGPGAVFSLPTLPPAPPRFGGRRHGGY